ncbi:hypothetical protein LCGC14_2284230, partial [marine sediment metagenome]
PGFAAKTPMSAVSPEVRRTSSSPRRNSAWAGSKTNSPKRTTAGACGGGEKTKEAEAPTATATTVSAPEPTTVLNEAWATEQMTPFTKDIVEAVLDQRWNDLYDMLSAGSKAACSRTEYVANIMGTMLFASAFGMDEFLKAVLLEIESGTYQITFSEISAERIVEIDEDGELTTNVFEDGQWRFVDDGTCGAMEMDYGEDDTAEAATCMDTYNEWVDEWNAHYEANDPVYQQYTIGGEIGTGFEGWAEDNGYDLCD